MPDLFEEAPKIVGRFRPKKAELSLDLYARQIAVASLLYYRHDQSFISDATFDAICQEVAAHWKDLSPIRRFMLGSARLIRASGNHVKVTRAAEDAAYAWMQEHRAAPSQMGRLTKWKWDDNHQVHWAGVSS